MVISGMDSLFKTQISYCKALGFTLIELMISLVIIAVVITLGVPTLLDTIVSNRVNSAIYELNKDIMSSRSYAVSYESTVTLCHLSSTNVCDGDWSKGYTVFMDANANRQFDAADDEKLIVRDIQNNNDTLVFTDGNALQYGFDGLISTVLTNEELAVFKYCPTIDNPEDYSRAILLNISGRPRASEDIDGDGKDELASASNHISCS